jgi:hypothetical protein
MRFSLMDNFTFTGDPLTRAMDALKVALHQVRLAQHATNSWRLEDALSEIEDDLGVDISRIRDAVEDDVADAEYSGEAEARRQPWLPRYRAA